jgi:hypothetical protein
VERADGVAVRPAAWFGWLLDGLGGRIGRAASSPTSTVWAPLGARTGNWWLNDGLWAKPATAGVAASPVAVSAVAVSRSKRFMSISKVGW